MVEQMPTELAVAIVTSTTAAVAAVASAWLSNRSAKKQDESMRRADEYRTQREKLDKAKNKVLVATMDGVLVLLHQAHGDKLNGNVTAAIEDIRDAKDELEDVRGDILAQA